MNGYFKEGRQAANKHMKSADLTTPKKIHIKKHNGLAFHHR